jgi:hypothetical protein
MDSDEREIFQFLKSRGEDFVSYREITRRAGGKQKFHKNQDWARPFLARMQERGILEADAQGRYRIKPVKSKSKATRWVSPDIAKILQEKGVKVEGSNINEVAHDDYYDGL